MRNDPAKSREPKEQADEACPHCRVEMIHAGELHCLPDEILAKANKVGPMLCYGRNRNAILGYSGPLPVMRPESGLLRGSSMDAYLTLDVNQWHRICIMQERSLHCGDLIGLEAFDAEQSALFRMAVAPDSEAEVWEELTRTFYRRDLDLEQVKNFGRIASLTSETHQHQSGPSVDLAHRELRCEPLSNRNGFAVDFEMGFTGGEFLARAIFSECLEEHQNVVVSIAGAFGYLSVSMQPRCLEAIQRGWLFIGGQGRALRLNAHAVMSYWIGYASLGDRDYSYLEALDCYGDLVFRLTSDNAQSYRYWQALARSTQL